MCIRDRYDILQLGCLFFLTGGITNPFIFLIIIPAIFSAQYLNILSSILLVILTSVILIILTLPILVLAYGVFSDDPAASAKIQEFFQQFQQLPSWFTNLWILVVASVFGIKGTQIFRNGKK